MIDLDDDVPDEDRCPFCGEVACVGCLGELPAAVPASDDPLDQIPWDVERPEPSALPDRVHITFAPAGADGGVRARERFIEALADLLVADLTRARQR